MRIVVLMFIVHSRKRKSRKKTWLAAEVPPSTSTAVVARVEEVAIEPLIEVEEAVQQPLSTPTRNMKRAVRKITPKKKKI